MFDCGSGDKSLGSTRTLEVSRANNVLPMPLAFINWLVVDMVADLASVLRATRIFGSGPASEASTGGGIVTEELEVGG